MSARHGPGRHVTQQERDCLQGGVRRSIGRVGNHSRAHVLVAQGALLRFAAYGRIVARLGDARVGRPAPGQVEVTVERVGLQFRGRRGTLLPRHRRDQDHPLDADPSAELGHPRGHLIIGDGGCGKRRHDTVLAGEQQPAEWGVLARLGAGPPYDGLMLGPGQCDVEQPQVLAPLLDLGEPLRAADEARCPVVNYPDVDSEAMALGGVVEDGHRIGRRPAVPQVRAVDDGELEAFAAMDRQHLHRLGIGFEPAAAVLVGTVVEGLGDAAP